MERPKISVLTTTYNRAHTLNTLYGSLLAQTSKNFEWVIVDDGSEDNTVQLIEQFINEGKISIKFFFQGHGGMHRGINRCVKESQGEWLFKIDSDDYIFPTTIRWLQDKIKNIEEDSSIALVSGCRCNTKGESWVIGFQDPIITTSFHELVYHKRITGEFAECFRGSVLRRYPWPEIEGEDYCDFSLVMYRMSHDGYKFQYYNEFIMVSEYSKEGLHSLGGKKNIKNPIATITCCYERIRLSIPFNDKIKLVKKFWYYYNFIPAYKKKPWIGIKWIWLYPGQYWRYLKNSGKLKRLKPIVALKYQITLKLRNLKKR